MNQNDRMRVQIATAVIGHLAQDVAKYSFGASSRDEWSDRMAEDAISITDAMVIRLRPKPQTKTESDDGTSNPDS